MGEEITIEGTIAWALGLEYCGGSDDDNLVNLQQNRDDSYAPGMVLSVVVTGGGTIVIKSVIKQGGKLFIKETVKQGEKVIAQKIIQNEAGTVIQNLKTIVVNGFKRVENHFNKHGKDFGAKNIQEYEKMAKNFFENNSKDIVQKINKYKDSIIRYNKKTNTFGPIDIETGEIRTFFKPSEGQKYFDKQ